LHIENDERTCLPGVYIMNKFAMEKWESTSWKSLPKKEITFPLEKKKHKEQYVREKSASGTNLFVL
jgi:hypothetical protein